MIKRDMVCERLSIIQDAIAVLERLSTPSKDEFASDFRNPAAAESYLRRALEATFDVGRHLLAASGHASLAAEYKSIARGLGQREVVSSDLAARLGLMAGYRNRLVHLYAQVTPSELHAIISANLPDLSRFVLAIESYLDTQP